MEREPLRLAVAQPACAALDVAANAARHAAAVCASHARVVVFPELSLTGYELEAPALSADDPRLSPIVASCRETGSVALVGAPIRDASGSEHIAMLAIDASGVRVAYRKLWVDASEARFAPGDAPAVLDVDGWRLGLGICKDTSVEQHWADTAALGIDAYVAGVVLFPDELAKLDERGQRIARRHGVWVALASFAGPSGSGYDHTAGGSGIWSPDGAPVVRAGPESGAIVCATLS